jgi:hypothetical protein
MWAAPVWHTYSRVPWFLAWGLLCIVALRVAAPVTRNPDATVTVR